jgi:polyhydroxybutyrate depolymerase
MMTLALACSRPDLLAGAAVIEGTLTSSCGPHRPLSLLVVHQTADPIVPLNGSAHPPAVLDTTGPFPPVADAVEAWLTSEGCGRQALPAAPAAGQLDRTVLPCPGSTTTIFDLAGGGSHVWPLRAPLDATAELIRFFNLGS